MFAAAPTIACAAVSIAVSHRLFFAITPKLSVVARLNENVSKSPSHHSVP
jgi:hypothetical protein